MARPIKLHCRCCGRQKDYARGIDPQIPERVARIEMDMCDECDTGDFGSETWYDASGNEVVPELQE